MEYNNFLGTEKSIMGSEMNTENKKREWHMGSYHEVTISEGTTNEKRQEVYTAWASTYDKDVLDNGYSGPQIVAMLMFKLRKSNKISVIDIGCGTGLFVQIIVKQSRADGIDLTLDGLDYCDAMLDLAKDKNLYSSLINADMTVPLPVPDNSYDFVIAGGVFVEGHTKPDVIPNITKCLKSGGHAIFTVRQKTFENAEQMYYDAFQKAKCTLIEMPLLHYFGPVHAYYVVLRKL